MLLRHYLEQGTSKSALARQLGVSRDTIHAGFATASLIAISKWRGLHTIHLRLESKVHILDGSLVGVDTSMAANGCVTALTSAIRGA